jgi:hypothetical protein
MLLRPKDFPQLNSPLSSGELNMSGLSPFRVTLTDHGRYKGLCLYCEAHCHDRKRSIDLIIGARVTSNFASSRLTNLTLQHDEFKRYGRQC